jgi:hypothetical protein
LKLRTVLSRLGGMERAEGEAPQDWVLAFVKIACIFVIGVVMLSTIASNSFDINSSFYSLYNNVISTINSGYTLAALMLLTLGTAAVFRYLGLV